VVISHDVPEVLSLCDRYALIYNGRIVAEGEVSNNQVSNANEFITQFLKGEVDGPIRLS
jgi:ABC-type transporter Mla maintaining outer membrane lipid asymmetry ATPase subunit MlaF